MLFRVHLNDVGSAKLADGTVLRIRPIRPEDAGLLIEGFKRLSPETIRQRFFSPLRELPPSLAQQLADVDHVTRSAVIAEVETASGMLPVGVARYEPSGEPGVVEIAVTVCDEWQNRCIGRLLLREILRVARANGIYRFKAEVLAENRRMMHLLSSEANVIVASTSGGVSSLLLTHKARSAA